MLISSVEDIVREHEDLTRKINETRSALYKLSPQYHWEKGAPCKDERSPVQHLHKELNRLETLRAEFTGIEVMISVEVCTAEMADFLGLEKA